MLKKVNLMKRSNSKPSFSFPSAVKDILSKNSAIYPLFIHFINYLFAYGHYKNLMESTRCYGKFNQPSHLALGIKKKYFKRLLFLLKYFLCNKSNSVKSDIVFITRYRPLKIKQNNEIFETCYLFNNIIEEIHQNYSHIVMSLVTFGPEKKYKDPRVLNFNLFEFSSFRDIINSLIKAFCLHLEYKSIRGRIYRYREIFDKFFSIEYLFFIHLRDFATKRMIEKMNPTVIVSNDDILKLKPHINDRDFCFFVVQSATICSDIEKVRGFLYSTFHVESKFFADYFLVSGAKIKEVKEKFSRDAKQIIVTGQPRYDILYVIKRNYDRNEILKKLGLETNKKIVLWTTQTHALSLDENVKNITAVYHAMRDIKNAQLIIKLHPAEDQQAPLYTKDKSIRPIIFRGEEDTYSLIAACDILITKHSTTAMEAIALNKPVIILSLDEKTSKTDYEKEKVALGVRDKKDLKPLIEKLLRGDLELSKNRERYIEKYLYKIDGKASKRAVGLIIKELIKRKSDE